MTRRLGWVALAAAIAALLPSVAGATEISGSQLRALAARAAAGDPATLAELRGVTTVDGRPAAIAEALAAESTQQLRARLLTLSRVSGGTSPATPEAAGAQRQAAEILGAQRYSPTPVPDPVGSLLRKLAHAIGRLSAGAPGGPAVFWGAVAAAVLALTFLGVRRSMRRLDPALQARAGADVATGDTPQALERDATAAEARGAFGEAVRLRFRAGLLSLSARRAIDYRPSLLTTDVSRTLHSPEFDALAATFERIAYGGAPGAAADAADAREGWKALLTRERR
jgi:hypothetical protein